MASDDKKAKSDPTPKSEAAPKEKVAPKEKDKSTSGVKSSKAESGETPAATASGYSGSEGQKPVSQAYKDNWNAIYRKKKKKR